MDGDGYQLDGFSAGSILISTLVQVSSDGRGITLVREQRDLGLQIDTPFSLLYLEYCKPLPLGHSARRACFRARDGAHHVRSNHCHVYFGAEKL